MSIIVGLLTIIATAAIVRMLGAREDNVGCYTILILLFGLPFVSNIGKMVMDIF